MTDRTTDVILVGFENRENLGLRSIMSYLQAKEFKTVLLPFYPGRDVLTLSMIRDHNPLLVGFSIIFQYALNDFGKLMSSLRANGVKSHFTAGGHFPSLRPELTLGLIPELDSIVRFEGELTMHELLIHLHHPEHWKKICGLAFRSGPEIVLTEPRPLVADLDTLPPVYRDEPKLSGRGVKTAAMLASRGCLFNCSFCSIRQFYGGTHGALRRVRSPQSVVEEMLALFTEKGVVFFSFQDDDFAARTGSQRFWLHNFMKELEKSGLVGHIRWKISCRVDDLAPDILEKLLEHGLFYVYLGVESGSEAGLRTLNKHVSVEQNLSAIDLLKRYNVAMSIGFMLFDPESTINSVRENIEFLRIVGKDGYFPINFCKMLPYAGTPIETKLCDAGRLVGTVTQPNYGFIDPRIDFYGYLVHRIFYRRNFSVNGIWSIFESAISAWRLERSLGRTVPAGYGKALNGLVSQTNMLALETLGSLLNEVVSHDVNILLKEPETLLAISEQEWRGEMMAEIEFKDIDKLWQTPSSKGSEIRENWAEEDFESG